MIRFANRDFFIYILMSLYIIKINKKIYLYFNKLIYHKNKYNNGYKYNAT